MRTFDSAIDDELDNAALKQLYFIQIDFDDGVLRLHTDLGSIDTLGFTWTGTGTLGSIGVIEERADRSAVGTTLTLSGLDATILAEALTQPHYGRAVTIYSGMRNILTGAMLSNPFEAFSGQIDQMIIDSGILKSITVTVESEWIMFDRSPLRWFSDSQLQMDFAGDLGFHFLAHMANLKITLGNGTTTYLGSYPGAVK